MRTRGASPRTAAAVITAALAAAVGCGSSPAGQAVTPTDHPDGASPRLPACRLEPGRSWRFATFAFLGSEAARDYGDGVPRNALGFLATPTIQSIILGQIQNGSVLFGMHIVGFTGDTPPDVLEARALQTMELLTVAGANGADPDGGALCADPQQFNVDCTSWGASEAIRVDAGVITATANPWPFVARNFGVGTIPFHRAQLVIEKAGSSWDDLKVTLQAVWPACSLASTIGPNSASMLDFITTKRQEQPEGAMPDFDLGADRGLGAAGDRAPLVRNESGFVTACEIDGQTIPGARCACDPRFDVGYTMAITFSGEKATVEALCDEP